MARRGRDLKQLFGHRYDLACDPTLLGAVQAMLGCDELLLFSSHVFARRPGETALEATGLDWHHARDRREQAGRGDDAAARG